jgi:hypothetical protein
VHNPDEIRLIVNRDSMGFESLWMSSPGPDRADWPILMTGDDDDELEAGGEIVARAHEGRFVTDRARTATEDAVHAFRRGLDKFSADAEDV